MELSNLNDDWWIENEGEKIELKPNLPELKKDAFGNWWFEDSNKCEQLNISKIFGDNNVSKSVCIEVVQMDFSELEKDRIIFFFYDHNDTRFWNEEFTKKYKNDRGVYEKDLHLNGLRDFVKCFDIHQREFIVSAICQDIKEENEYDRQFLLEFEKFVKPKLIELYLEPDKVTDNTDDTEQPDDPTDKRMERTREFICDKFKAMHKDGWQYAFKDENDYNKFVEILSDFFVNETYTKPENIINLNRRTKTRFARKLNEIYNDFKDNGTKKTDSKFYDLVRCLNHFEQLSDSDIYNAMTK